MAIVVSDYFQKSCLSINWYTILKQAICKVTTFYNCKVIDSGNKFTIKIIEIIRGERVPVFLPKLNMSVWKWEYLSFEFLHEFLKLQLNSSVWTKISDEQVEFFRHLEQNKWLWQTLSVFTCSEPSLPWQTVSLMRPT